MKAGDSTADVKSLAALTGEDPQDVKDLVQLGIVTLPSRNWLPNWKRVNLLGVMLSALMLSLGAPFWYNALKNLVRLRSVIAGKDDDQRANRQTSASPPAAATTGTPAESSPQQIPALTGERGILG